MEKPPSPEERSLKLPEDPDLKARLEAKLSEYKARLDAYEKNNALQAPEMRAQFTVDTRYKIKVLESLLHEGKVEYTALSEELNKQDSYFVADVLRNAFMVMEDYVKTGGVKARGGTGLPKTTR